MASAIMQLVATNSSKVRMLPIKNGQLVFVQDSGRIALDFNGKRKFYNQIMELETEAERIMLEDPLEGYYFIVSSACLWFYKDEWIQITEKPEDVLFIDVELPQLGQAKEGVLYVNKTDKEIAVFDGVENDYVVVSNKTNECTAEDIENMFN